MENQQEKIHMLKCIGLSPIFISTFAQFCWRQCNVVQLTAFSGGYQSFFTRTYSQRKNLLDFSLSRVCAMWIRGHLMERGAMEAKIVSIHRRIHKYITSYMARYFTHFYLITAEILYHITSNFPTYILSRLKSSFRIWMDRLYLASTCNIVCILAMLTLLHFTWWLSWVPAISYYNTVICHLYAEDKW